jgi:hypothetical protein
MRYEVCNNVNGLFSTTLGGGGPLLGDLSHLSLLRSLMTKLRPHMTLSAGRYDKSPLHGTIVKVRYLARNFLFCSDLGMTC